MGKIINTLKFGAGFNVSGNEPVDSRCQVEYEEDLYNEWDNNLYGLYKGMSVLVLYTGTSEDYKNTGERQPLLQRYVLLDPDNYSDKNSWKKEAAGGVSDDLDAINSTLDDYKNHPIALSVTNGGALQVSLGSGTNNTSTLATPLILDGNFD